MGKCNRAMSAILKKHRARPTGDDADLEEELMEDLACDCEIQGIDIAVVLHRKNHVEVGVADIAALHVDEKLPAKLVSEGVCTHRQAFERLHEG